MSLFILLSVFAFSISADVSNPQELRDTVTAYWDLMVRNDKASALKFVLESCRNDFINRDEPKVKAWRYIGDQPINEREVEVTVELEALFKGAPISAGFQKMEKRETWIRDENGWKLKVTKPSPSSLAAVLTGGRTETLPSVLQITPSTLRIQFLNKSQVGRVTIQNGTESPAEIVSVKFDESRFELASEAHMIQAGEKVPLALRYKGTENDKNLQSSMSLVLKHDGQEKLFQIPIVYNYLSEGAR
ncbi:MAG TPA: hypothetical protein PLP42_04390, partial [Acidobacteriota bacterium]|nr:hypothetical protein [Acidobacteriota bacterium]